MENAGMGMLRASVHLFHTAFCSTLVVPLPTHDLLVLAVMHTLRERIQLLLPLKTARQDDAETWWSANHCQSTRQKTFQHGRMCQVFDTLHPFCTHCSHDEMDDGDPFIERFTVWVLGSTRHMAYGALAALQLDLWPRTVNTLDVNCKTNQGTT